MHPAKEGFAALPFFDEFDLSTVDILLISQYVDPFFISQVLPSVGAEGRTARRGICAIHENKLRNAISSGGPPQQKVPTLHHFQHVHQKSMKMFILFAKRCVQRMIPLYCLRALAS